MFNSQRQVNENNLPIYFLLVQNVASGKSMKSFPVKLPIKHNTGLFLHFFILTMEGITQTFATSSQT